MANLRPLKDWNHEAEPHIKERGYGAFSALWGFLPMQRFTHASHLTNFHLWLWLALVFTSCEDSFMKQATANKMGAVANLQTTRDSEGNFVAQIDPTKAETQLMRVTEGAIAGAAVAIPPSAISIPVSIMVGEGVALTTNSFSKDLGLTGNAITAGGPSVSFTASQDVVASNPLTLSIPFGALAFALADVDTENLVVMYRWMTLKDGQPSYEVGVIPGDKVTRGQNKVSFQTTKFGTFQVGISETKISRPLLAATEEPPALKSCERYAAAAFPSCTQDGQVGCVTTDSFKAADLSLAKSEFILAGKTMASITGNVTLPDPGKVLTNTSYGAGGLEKSGTLTLPDPSKVLASSAAYGNPSSLTTPTLTDRGVWDLGTSFAGAGYYSSVTNVPTPAGIASGATVLGLPIPAAPSLCSVDGAASCVVDGSNFKAAKLSDFGANDILSGKTIAGVSGAAPARPGACSVDGDFGCIVVGPTYAAAVVPGAASKILSGTSVAGIQGAAALRPAECSSDGESGCVASAPEFKAAKVTGSAQKILKNFSVAGIQGEAVLPPAGSVLSGMTYGNPDTQYQQIGTLILPDDKGVLSGGGEAVDPWHLRAGVSAGEMTGNLRTNCRNSGNPAIFTTQIGKQAQIIQTSPLKIKFSTLSDATSFAVSQVIILKVNSGSQLTTPTFKIVSISSDMAYLAAVSGSNPLTTNYQNANVTIYNNNSDPWDTIDDSLLSNLYQPLPTSEWDPSKQCGSIRTWGNLDGNWMDLSYAGGAGYSTCSATNCAFLDINSLLIWSRAPNPLAENWSTAKYLCQSNSTLNSYPGSAMHQWRLPTQKELMSAYANGINNVLVSSQLMDRTKSVWSGTTFVASIGGNSENAWTMSLSKGQTSPTFKTGTNHTLCVRDFGDTIVPPPVRVAP